MFKNGNDEADNVDEHISHIMFSMCQECRFMAALRIIDAADEMYAGEILEYVEARLRDDYCGPYLTPEPEHRGGGCYVRI